MKNVPDDPKAAVPSNAALLKDLESLGKSMRRVVLKCQDRRLASRAFSRPGKPAGSGSVEQLEPVLQERMKAFHDRSGQT